MHDNWAHTVTLDVCEDPDCELHNPEVGYYEMTVTETDLAFFMAGAAVMMDLIQEGHKAGFTFDQNIAAAFAEFRDLHVPILREES